MVQKKSLERSTTFQNGFIEITLNYLEVKAHEIISSQETLKNTYQGWGSADI